MKTSPAEKLLNSARKKIDQAEVVFSEGQSRTISFEDDKLKVLKAGFSSSIGLRLVKNGRVGVAATNKLEEFESLVDKALATSEFGPEAFFKFPKATTFSRPKTYDPTLVKISTANLVERGQEIINRIKKDNPKITVDLGFEVGRGESILLNSSGLMVTEKGANTGFAVEGKLLQERDFLQIEEGNEARRDELKTDFYVGRLLDKFKKAEKIVKIKPGRYPVIFTPSSLGSVLDFVTTALNGKMIVKKSSRLLGKLGKKVFDERLTVSDDGTLDWKTGSSKCDSEGVPVRPFDLIENGLVKNFYYDLQTAGQMKTESTGHGSRSKGAALASPGLNNVLVKEGKTPYGLILKNVKEGILAEQLLGVGQDNPFNGDFSFNLHLGYKIENGEIVGRVKDTMIAGNAFELLKSGIGEISKETEWIGNSFQCPYVVLEGLTVSSK